MFDQFGLAAPLLRAVAAEGYSTPTPIQTQAIPHVMAGSDLLGCAQTGTGKTAAFALPILHRLMSAEGKPPGRRKPRVLVLAPTRELAVQIGESFQVYGRHAGMRQVLIFGGVGQGPQVKALRSVVEIIVATPGRLLDLMNQGFVDLSAVEMFVLDEADRMMDMGFLPDVRRIIAKLPTKRQTLFFSATMPDPIMHLANAILRDPVQVRVAPVRETTELIEQSVCFVPQKQKGRLLAQLLTNQATGRVLVFTRTKHGADRVAKQLLVAGIKAEAIHGNKSQAARQRTLAAFKTDRVPVLVATDLAARGIDVDGISHVVNYDLPHEPETYVHRIGRTGRAGATGVAVSFCDQNERKHLQAIERLIRRRLVTGQHPTGGHHTAGHPTGGNGADAAPPASSDRSTTRDSNSRATRSGGDVHRQDGAANDGHRADSHQPPGKRRPGRGRPGRRERAKAKAAGLTSWGRPVKKKPRQGAVGRV
jgi:ATP-dependent RNA helicase RhlE